MREPVALSLLRAQESFYVFVDNEMDNRLWDTEIWRCDTLMKYKYRPNQ